MPRNRMTPAQASANGRIGGNALHAKIEDETAYTAPARAKGPAGMEYFEKQIDPEGTMDPAQRLRRATHLRRAYFARLAYLSAKSRRAKKATS